MPIKLYTEAHTHAHILKIIFPFGESKRATRSTTLKSHQGTGAGRTLDRRQLRRQHQNKIYFATLLLLPCVCGFSFLVGRKFLRAKIFTTPTGRNMCAPGRGEKQYSPACFPPAGSGKALMEKSRHPCTHSRLRLYLTIFPLVPVGAQRRFHSKGPKYVPLYAQGQEE